MSFRSPILVLACGHEQCARCFLIAIFRAWCLHCDDWHFEPIICEVCELSADPTDAGRYPVRRNKNMERMVQATLVHLVEWTGADYYVNHRFCE